MSGRDHLPPRCIEKPSWPAALVLGALGMFGSACDPALMEDVAGVSQSITNGTITDGYPTVVALLEDGRVHCSGVMVRPRVVLTAAHCLNDGLPDAVLFESPTGERRVPRVQRTWRHPDYAIGRSDFDLGLVLLPGPEDLPFLSISAEPVTADDVGAELHIVGFGRESAGDQGILEKREGTAMLDGFSARSFTLRAAPSLACAGDSGGPVLRLLAQGAVVVGTISNGDDHCTLQTEAVRTDAHVRTFIDPLIARIEGRSGALGASCIEDANCSSGSCLAPEDAPDFGYCSARCSRDDECAAGMHCATGGPDGGACALPRPSPGAIGSPCSSDSECQFGMCGSFADVPDRICSALCFPDAADSCPADSRCAAIAGSSSVWGCIPRSERAEDAHGCAATPGSGAILVALVVMLIGRRRPRNRART